MRQRALNSCIQYCQIKDIRMFCGVKHPRPPAGASQREGGIIGVPVYPRIFKFK